MQSPFIAKENPSGDTPVFLFDVKMADGTLLHWSNRTVTVSGVAYHGRVLKHNLFEAQLDSDSGIGGVPKIAFEAANADSELSQLERSKGFKGAIVNIRVAFLNVLDGTVTTESTVVFQGICNSPELIREDRMRLSASNRMMMQRASLPEVRVQRMCPWRFPATQAQRVEAVDGADRGRYSAIYRCGYSADVSGGLGNLNGGAPFTNCSNTRSDCEARGMFNRDSFGRHSGTFGGIEFVPASVLVRGNGQASYQVSAVQDNQARYNDSVPLVYGTQWHSPDIVFSRNDGNLTRMEVLLGMGPIEDVLKVVVAGVEIPKGQSGVNMTSTGWFNIISRGDRNGVQNEDFADGSGTLLGDPYGSMAYLSVVVPNRVSSGTSLPQIEVLMRGLHLYRFDSAGVYIDEAFTNNPAWVLLDVLMRSGWTLDELDKGSFARAAAYAGELIPVFDPAGGSLQLPRFLCDFALKSRVSAGDVIRSIRNSSRLYLVQNSVGLIEVRVENTLALQQPSKPAGSNATSTFLGGWAAYEFDESSIARRGNGESSFTVACKPASDSPNRYSIEFQDSLNSYQQDSLSLADGDDQDLCKSEVAMQYDAAGISTFHQASRALLLALNRSLEGNRYVSFDTSVKALGLAPGDLISVTCLKEGLTRVPFRISKISPGGNYRTATITAQIHDDSWYSDSTDVIAGALGRQPGQINGGPFPVAGTVLDSSGNLQLGFTERESTGSDGTPMTSLGISFLVPALTRGTLPAPLLGFVPGVAASGGALPGGSIFYYAVSAVDGSGFEGGRSFTIQAVTGSATTNVITLNGIQLPAGTVAFHVYRGVDPRMLFRVASMVTPSNSFVDAGLSQQPLLAPDSEFDHVDLFWRWEMLPETSVTGYSSNTITHSGLGLVSNRYAGSTLRITSGTGAGQEQRIVSNTADTITLLGSWHRPIGSSSRFTIAEGAWQSGCTALSSPASFDIPERVGVGVQVLALAANVVGEEAPADISPVSRWVIGSSGSLSVDSGAPGVPHFGASVAARRPGSLQISNLSFTDLMNTRGIVSASIKIHNFDELRGTVLTLGGAATAGDTSLSISPPPSAGSIIQIGRELVSVTAVTVGGVCQVERGYSGTTATSHDVSTPVYLLSEQDYVVLFEREFFGSSAAATWNFLAEMPFVRVACVELFVTNAFGDSPTAVNSYTSWQTGGLRTLGGGQMNFQVTGYLAIQSGAAPDLLVDMDRAVGSIAATVRGAADGPGIDLLINRNGTAYCTLHFEAGVTDCTAVSGFGLPTLQAGDRLSLDITGVGTNTPGNDLTVVLSL